jgi:hypothetical protein
MHAAREIACFARRDAVCALALALLSLDRMSDVRRGSLLAVMLVSVVVVGGCRFGRVSAPRPTTVAPSSSFAPCCEREVVYDLFDAAHRQGTR